MKSYLSHDLVRINLMEIIEIRLKEDFKCTLSIEQLFTLYTLAPTEVNKILSLAFIVIKDRGALFDYFYQYITKDQTIKTYLKRFFFDIKLDKKIKLSGHSIDTIERLVIENETHSVISLTKSIDCWSDFLVFLDKIIHLACQGKWSFHLKQEALASLNSIPILFRS